jgi:hypothetical protein
MKTTTVLASLGAGIGAGVIAARRFGTRALPPAALRRDDRHHTVTVLRPPGEVAPGGRLPDRLAELGDLVDVKVVPAPAGRGTELHVYLRDEPPGGAAGLAARLDGEHPAQQVRTALRETKQLLETGEILSPTRPGSSRPTPLNAPLRKAVAVARGEGVS